jgi:hypothetical protein
MWFEEVDEAMRIKLLEEEKKMREKQPQAWTAQKYRKYANFGRNRKKVETEEVAVTTTETATAVETK